MGSHERGTVQGWLEVLGQAWRRPGRSWRGRPIMAVAMVGAVLLGLQACLATPLARRAGTTDVKIPAARPSGAVLLEEALTRRRSAREFSARPLDAAQVAQLLWAAQGVTSTAGGRTAPSAGALYPLEVYVAKPDGVFHYLPATHSMVRTGNDDVRPALCKAALGQEAVRQAAAVFVITGVVARTQQKYGARALRYVCLEAGHAAQNLLLQATALGLGAVPIGAFEDDAVGRLLSLPAGETPLYLVPVGHTATAQRRP